MTKQHAHVIALTCSDPPEGWIRWTLRLLGKLVTYGSYVGLAQQVLTINRLLSTTLETPCPREYYALRLTHTLTRRLAGCSSVH